MEVSLRNSAKVSPQNAVTASMIGPGIVRILPRGAPWMQSCQSQRRLLLIFFRRSMTELVTHARKGAFRASATTIKLVSLGMSAAATIILGLVELTKPVAAAFILTALVTLLNALEAYFNFRSRWIIMEEGQARFHRLKDDLEFALTTSSPGGLPEPDLHRFHDRFQEILALHVWRLDRGETAPNDIFVD